MFTKENDKSPPCHNFNDLLSAQSLRNAEHFFSNLSKNMSDQIGDQSGLVLKSNKKGLKTKWILYFCLIVVCIALITLFARPCPEGYLTTSLERAGRNSSLQDSILKYNEAI